MFSSSHRNKFFSLFLMTSLLLLSTQVKVHATEAPRVNYIFSLSRFTGPVAYQWVRLTTDAQYREVYVLNTRTRAIDIYNRGGMEVYSLNLNQALGTLKDVTVDKQGNIYVLAATRQGSRLLKLNFRGEFINDMQLAELPDEFSDFSPDRIVIYQDTFFLASLGRKQIVKTDLFGQFLAGFLVDELLVGISEEDKLDSVLGDFSVDKEGRPIFTIPLLWLAGTLNFDGTLVTFGQRGNAPGKFGIIKGIAADENGLTYVSDILRSVVMVFDQQHRFLKEFGGRGHGVENLIGPSHLAMEGDLLYVTQLRNRGVSVFKCTVTP